jgi:hypothetical protein
VSAECAESIEKRYPGQRYVFSRRRCKRRTTHPSGYCCIHRATSRDSWCSFLRCQNKALPGTVSYTYRGPHNRCVEHEGQS